MKTYTLTPILFFLSILCLKAQIGINTENPKYLIHIDGSGNNPSSGTVAATYLTDDVIIDTNGNIGIGAIPKAKVHVYGKLAKTNQTGTNAMRLVSDANGYATWQTYTYIPVTSQKGAFSYASGSVANVPAGTAWTTITPTPITVTAGTWLVYAKVGGRSSQVGSCGTCFLWIRLITKGGSKVWDVAGSMHESSTSNPANASGYWAAPQFMTLVTVTATTILEIQARDDDQTQIIDAYGGSHFGAIKLL